MDIGALQKLSDDYMFVGKTFEGAFDALAEVVNHPEFEFTGLETAMAQDFSQLASAVGEESEYVVVKAKFSKGPNGFIYFAFPKSAAKVLVDILLGGDGDTPIEVFEDIHYNSFREVIKRWASGWLNDALAQVFGNFVEISPIEVKDISIREGSELELEIPSSIVVVKYSYKINEKISSYILILIPVEVADQIRTGTTTGSAADAGIEETQVGEQTGGSDMASQDEIDKLLSGVGGDTSSGGDSGGSAGDTSTSSGDASSSGSDLQAEIESLLQDVLGDGGGAAASTSTSASTPTSSVRSTTGAAGGASESAISRSADPMVVTGGNKIASTEVAKADFAELDRGEVVKVPANLEILLDVPLELKVEIGRARLRIRDILEMSVGSIVELDKLAGESVDIYVNDKLIAKGEVVVIDENFGVRITNIVSQEERLKAI